MIHTFHAKNYGCLVDVTAELTPLHAFIGPNDSGKSTLLRGLRTVVQLASDRFHKDEAGVIAPFDPDLPSYLPLNAWFGPPFQSTESDLLLGCSFTGGWYIFEAINGARGQAAKEARGTTNEPFGRSGGNAHPRGVLSGGAFRGVSEITEHLRSARLVQFDPDELRKPSPLILEAQPIGFVDDRGFGLASVYFAIRNRSDNAFDRIIDDVRKHFPTIRGLRVKVVTPTHVALEAELASGARIDAKRMSEGLLYYLAYAALRHLDPVQLLLVEEPENGLHPARIAEVMRILRAIVAEGTQVILATHSPLVVNELHADEVSIVTRDPKLGTRVKRIKDTPDFEDRAKVYALGELWIAYANGDDEAPLLEGTEP